MMRTLFASLRSNRLRLIMTALAVALGTSLMCGSLVFTASLTHSIDALIGQQSAGADVEVQHAAPPGATAGAGSAAARPVPASLLTAIRAVPGVAAAGGAVTGRAVLLARGGAALPVSFGVAMSWPAQRPFQAAFTHRSGRPPAGPGQIMIDRNSARAGRYAVGDRIEAAIGGQARWFTITGITGYGSAGSIPGGSLAVFSLRTAQRLLGRAGQYDTIEVKAASGVSAGQLRGRVAAVLPAGVSAVTVASAAASEAHQLNSQLSVLTTFFLAFAGVALFVGAFVIWNTFSIMIGQRTRQLALLRALGAGRGQVFRSVLAEAAVTGAAAALVGVAAGIAVARGLAALLSAFGLSLPVTGLVVPPGQVAAAGGIAVATTVAAALAPAWRATRVAPVRALRDAAAAPGGFPAARLAAGLAVTAAGAGLVLTGLLAGLPLAVAAAGTALCFAGVTVLGPLLARPLAAAAGLPLLRLPGRAGVLARRNTMGNPKRTSATAAALMIGLAVIIAASVLVSSARTLITGQISAAGKTSYYVQAVNADIGITPALVPVLARQPGVHAVTGVRSTDATVAGAAHTTVDGVDPARIAAFTSLGVRSGSLAALARGQLLVSQAAAAAHHWRTGGEVTIGFGSFGVSRLRIGGIFTSPGPLADYLLGSAAFAAGTGRQADTVDLVRAGPSARGPLQRALAGYPGAQLLSRSAYAASRSSTLASLLNLITALLALTVVVALLGIVNTLALSIVERTRELGLLRAIGLGRGQLAQLIAAESVIIALIGALLGAILGLGLGAALAFAATRAQQATVTIPWGMVAACLLAAGVAGLLAAAAPARRAARLDLLTAIAAE